jgi:hypothetical protein
MKLNLKFDSRLKVDDGIILIPAMKRVTQNLKDGSFLNVSGDNGRKVKLKVGSSPNTNSYVSRKTLYSLYNQETVSVTLGCDPEFVLVGKDHKVCRAEGVLTDILGSIGNDGALGEFRPDPGNNEIEVTENLRKLIKRLPSMIDKKFPIPGVLHAEGHSEKQNCAAGFHIHLGAPAPLTTRAALGSQKFLQSFATALDFFVGIPGMLIEQSDLRRIGDGKYGKAGDIRTSKFGTIEYRSLGGFHLRHPDYTRGVLALAQCASKDILTHMEGLSCGWAYLSSVNSFETLQDKYNLPNRFNIEDAFKSKKKDKALYMLERVIKVVSTLDSYEEHRESIDRFLKLVINNTIYSPKLSDNW